MSELFEAAAEASATAVGPAVIHPACKLQARVAGLYVADSEHFVSRPVASLPLSFEGIVGDLHAGWTRRSGGREPWYRRGTEMRNARQLTLVAADELAQIAARMGVAEVLPEWLGANLLLAGVPALSMLPAGSLLFFAGGVTLKIDGQNAPCRLAGGAVAAHAGCVDRAQAALRFAKVAKRLRGLTAWVEKPGTIAAGEALTVRIPEQWIYAPDQTGSPLV